MFNRLRQGKWFDGWLLIASMIMSNKPSFIRYGYSVPLDQLKQFSRNGKIKRVARPLAG